METNSVKTTLELTFVDGKTLVVDVAGYHLKLNSKLYVGAEGKVHKLGTLKINSSAYQSWGAIKAVKYSIGGCVVLMEHTPKTTPRTITYKVRQDF